jgi:hypothetical protein
MIEKLYDEFIENTHWSDDEYTQLYELIKAKKEIHIAKLDLFDNPQKLFRMLEFLKCEGKIYAPSKHMIAIIG